jgi:hypothetical protein
MEVIEMKLTGKKKTAFLKRMAAGRKKAQTKRSTPKKVVKRVRKSVKVKRKRISNNTNNMKRKSRKSSSRRKSATSFLNNPTLKKVMIGLGASSLAGTVVSLIAPQYAPIAKPIAALAVGGPIGAVASVIADGGFSSLGGIIGGVTGQSSQSSGGLSV